MSSFNCNYCFFILLIFPILVVPQDYSDCGIGVDYLIPRIINGQIAGVHQYPWMAVISNGFGISCGGFLIDSSHVITARHCLRDNMKVYLGMNNLQHLGEPIEVNEIWKPEKNPDTDDDIAILTLSKPIEFNESIRPICLPKSDAEPFKKLTVIGFGRTETGRHSDELRHVEVDFISRPECVNMNGKKLILDDVTMCAFNLNTHGGTCSGDSGGPLMYKKDGRFFAVGIVSRGYFCPPGAPTFYTIVAKYRDTIIQIAKEAQFRDY